MSSFAVSPAAVTAEIPRRLPLQVASPSAEPPHGKGWLHEVKRDGHRLVAIGAGDDLKLVSLNGYDRTSLFSATVRRAPRRWPATAGFFDRENHRPR